MRREHADPETTVLVRVAGFAGQPITPSNVVALVRQVPRFHLSGLNEIVFEREPGRAGAAAPCAAYYSGPRSIRFFRLPGMPVFRHALYHEIGHHVFSLVLSSKVKALWMNRIALRTPPVSAYGASGPQEDFAEAYAMYLAPEADETVAGGAKPQFMRDLVFSGNPWTLKEKAML